MASIKVIEHDVVYENYLPPQLLYLKMVPGLALLQTFQLGR